MKNLIFILCLFPCYLFGQDTIAENNRKPLLIIKYSLLSLMDFYHPSIQFAAEYPISRQWSLQHEGGYIKYLFFSGDDHNMRGIRIRNEARYYFSKKKDQLTGFYFGPEILFIRTLFERKTDCDGFPCVGEREFFTMSKTVFAPHLKIGYQFGVNRFMIDLYLGGGYRYVNVKNINKPENVKDPATDLFSIQKRPGEYNLPSLSLGFKIGFLFLRK